MKMKRFIDSTMIKFLLVGGVNTLIGCGTMFLLYNLFHCSYWISSASAYVIASIVSFFLNKYFTFQNHTRSWNQIVKFILNVTVCYFVAYGVAKPAVLWLLPIHQVEIQENIAMIIGMGIYTVLNYFGQRFFTFQSEKKV